FPDVRSLGQEELSKIGAVLKRGETHIVFTGQTGKYDSMRKLTAKDPVKQLMHDYKNASYLEDDPGSDFEKFMEWTYDGAVYNDKAPEYEGNKTYQKMQQTIEKIYVPSVEITGAG